VKSAIGLALGGFVLLSASGCGASPSAPSPGALSSSGPRPLVLSGTWNGSGTDAQGPETFTWNIVQSGTNLSGSVMMEPLNKNDGSCGSCHKQKAGTFSGTLSGTTLALTLDFPAGGADLTPHCALTMTATTSEVNEGRIAAAYTGSTTCEGPITDGTLVMTR
jgi:hypothetical protein